MANIIQVNKEKVQRHLRSYIHSSGKVEDRYGGWVVWKRSAKEMTESAPWDSFS